MKFERVTRAEVEARRHATKPARVVPLPSDAEAFGDDSERTLSVADVDPAALARVRDATAAFDVAHDLLCDAIRRPRHNGETEENRQARLARLKAVRETAWKHAVEASHRLLRV